MKSINNSHQLKQIILVFAFVFIVGIFCKFIFIGFTNIYITIIIMCFLSTIILCCNYKKKKEYVANGFALWLQINKKEFESSIFLKNLQYIIIT